MKEINVNRNDHLIINNKKLIMNIHKKRVHRQVWQDVFKISDLENQQYDRQAEITVREYLNNNNYKITVHQTSDINRLQNNSLLIQPITLEDIKTTIESFKTNTPGETIINKTI